MKDPVAELKTRPPGFGFSLTGNSRGGGAISWIRTVMNSGLRLTHGSAGFFLKVSQYLCLLLASVCLGSDAFEYARARIFQSYQSWRFDRVIQHQPPSQMPLLTRWIDQVFSSLTGEPVERLNHDRFHPNAPALAGRSSVPAVRSLPLGSLVGRMEIPRIGISVMVLEGDGDGVLRKAVGHVPTTAFPGGQGNVVIAGHRDTFFRALRGVRRDDQITLTTTQGVYNYQVGSIEEVGPQDIQVLKASIHPTLTLITCYPFDYIGPAPKRFVVQASETQSSEIAELHHSFASGRPTIEPHLRGRSTLFARYKDANLDSSRSPSDSPRTRLATTLTQSSSAMDGPESTQARAIPTSSRVPDGVIHGQESARETADAQQADPPAKSPGAPHKIYRKVRAWFGSIPRRLLQK